MGTFLCSGRVYAFAEHPRVVAVAKRIAFKVDLFLYFDHCRGVFNFKYGFAALKKPVLIRVILWSWLVYIVAYLFHAFFIQYFYHISYLSLNVQGVQWAGPNYAVLPLVVAIPAALLYLRQGFGLNHWLGWLAIIATLAVGYVFDSRAAFIGVAAFIIASPTILGLRKFIPFALIGAGLTVFFYWRTLQVFLAHLLLSVTFSYEGDEGRYAIILASIDAISQRVDTFFFGYGINSHHYVLAPFMKAAGHPTITQSPDYNATVLPGGDFVYASIGGLPDYVRVTGFGSLLTDIGIVGAILLLSVFFVLALRLLVLVKAPGRFAALISLVLILNWMLFSKVEDIVLIWFIMMPAGILLELARDDDAAEIRPPA